MAAGFLALAGILGACSSSGSALTASQVAELKKSKDTADIDQIEVIWHRAASRHDVNLMMTLWTDDATFTVGSQTYTGSAEIRNFFATKAAPFKPQNHWVSDTPAYKIRITLNGDTGTLYFECHYVDVKTRKVAAVVGADQNVVKINGRWLIKSSIAASPVLSA